MSVAWSEIVIILILKNDLGKKCFQVESLGLLTD